MTHIAILTYPEAQLAAVLGMTDLLAAANTATALDPAEPPLVVSHWRKTPSGTQVVQVLSTGTATSGPNACIMPPSLQGPPEPDPVTTRWLQTLHGQGCVMASVCTGAFVLGGAGLLDGHTVTTHWTYEARFRKAFPLAQIDADRLIVDEGDVVTAGGVMSWTDLALTLIERYRGRAVMSEVARGFLLDPPGRRQSYYSSFAPALDHGDAPIRQAQILLADRMTEEISLAELASAAGLEQRTFLRRFTKATGLTATAYRQRLRISRAQDLLRNTKLTTERIGWDVGYADPSAFRKVFHTIVGLSATEYRKRFASDIQKDDPNQGGLGRTCAKRRRE